MDLIIHHLPPGIVMLARVKLIELCNWDADELKRYANASDIALSCRTNGCERETVNFDECQVRALSGMWSVVMEWKYFSALPSCASPSQSIQFMPGCATHWTRFENLIYYFPIVFTSEVHRYCRCLSSSIEA